MPAAAATAPVGRDDGGRVELIRLGDSLAQVRLVHPGKQNAMSRAMWRQLRTAFNALAADAQLRCILVAGADGHFCAGGDISEYPSFRFDAASLRDFHENDVWGGLQAMLACDVPVVACIEGNCMGAGVEIACCCDIRLAGQSAHFGAPIAKLGFPMAPRETALLLREAGALTVRQLLLEAAVLPAPELQARGFLHRVLPDADLPQEAQRCAQRIAQLAPQATRQNKRTIRLLNEPLAQMVTAQTAMKNIADGVTDAYAYAPCAEHREGICAFIDKRRPEF